MSQPTPLLKQAPWTNLEKIGFRFSFIFFGLFIFPFPIDVLPYIGSWVDWYTELWNHVIYFSGRNIFRISYYFLNTSRGDSTAGYIKLGVTFFAACTGTVIWTILDRKRPDYNRLNYWFTAGVRYFLAYIMLVYGFGKIFKSQFPTPGLARLLEPYGMSSPHGLAWTFLGFSKGYNYFMGFAEVIGGILLFFRRTSTFGALVLISVILNVVMINFCFDISVKIESSLYFLMALYIAVPDSYRIIRFFFLHRDSRLRSVSFSFRTPWKKVLLVVAKFGLVVYLLYINLNDGIERYYQFGDGEFKPGLYGYYNVETFVKNRDTLQVSDKTGIRWNKMVFGERKRISVKMMNDTLFSFNYKDDTAKRRLTLTERADTSLKYSFLYTAMADSQLILKSRNRPDSLYLVLKKLDPGEFLLMKRGFHWILEQSFNR